LYFFALDFAFEFVCGEFVFKCYYELKENKSERWNYFKGDYDNMKNELNQDWD
jgi:hypothetical protein